MLKNILDSSLNSTLRLIILQGNQEYVYTLSKFVKLTDTELIFYDKGGDLVSLALNSIKTVVRI